MIIWPLLWLRRDSCFKLLVLMEQHCFEVSDHCKYRTDINMHLWTVNLLSFSPSQSLGRLPGMSPYQLKTQWQLASLWRYSTKRTGCLVFILFFFLLFGCFLWVFVCLWVCLFVKFHCILFNMPHSLQVIQLILSEKIERGFPLKHNLIPMGTKPCLICMQEFIVTRKISWNKF